MSGSTRFVVATCGGLVCAIPAAYLVALAWATSGRVALADDLVLVGLWVACAAFVARRETLREAGLRVCLLAAITHGLAPVAQMLVAGDARATSISVAINGGALLCAFLWAAAALAIRRLTTPEPRGS